MDTLELPNNVELQVSVETPGSVSFIIEHRPKCLWMQQDRTTLNQSNETWAAWLLLIW